MDSPLPLPVERAIQKLGRDISLARRRRYISPASLAERIGAALTTMRCIEKAMCGSIHFIARAQQARHSPGAL